MFGLGWGEMVVIGIVALVAIGPKELPTVLRTVGLWMGKVRRMANEFQGQFQEALREAELSDLKKHADDIASDISKFDPVADTQKDLEKAFDFDDPLKGIDTALEPKPAEANVAEAGVTASAPIPDGALLPAATIPTSDMPPFDVPLPDVPASVTETDFAADLPPQDTQLAHDASATPQASPQAKTGT
jgi:sec-independent protein translocase protein TatB